MPRSIRSIEPTSTLPVGAAFEMGGQISTAVTSAAVASAAVLLKYVSLRIVPPSKEIQIWTVLIFDVNNVRIADFCYHPHIRWRIFYYCYVIFKTTLRFPENKG